MLFAATMGEILKEARLMREWSRNDLAELTGFSANAIAKYEKAGKKGGQYPSMPRLAKLCALLELDARLILALCAEDQETSAKIVSTDAVGSITEAFGDILSKIAISFAKVREEATKNGDFDDLEELDQVENFFATKSEAALGILAAMKNKKTEEASLATSSPGFDSTSTDTRKVND